MSTDLNGHGTCVFLGSTDTQGYCQFVLGLWSHCIWHNPTAMRDLFVCLFVCCYTTRKSLLRIPPWARSKTLGSISSRAA